MLNCILADSRIETWDVFGLGFPSSLRIDVPKVWSADPDISIIAKSLRTTLSLPPFRDYGALALAAHSMGGLVVQRAILDDGDLTKRVANLLISGTPSGGLPKARLVSRLKRQFRDMSPRSDFILELRADWKERFGNGTPFDFRVVAGDRDEFVPSSSSLVPFPTNVQAVVPGNHLEIVKPNDCSHPSAQLMVTSLGGGHRALPAVDSAKLAVELGQFKEAVAVLLPDVAALDDNGIVALALALEGTGNGAKALQILEQHYKGGTTSTEAMGTLAGRLKRRWLTSRAASDFNRALVLYRAGLQGAECNGDFDQAYYHAINVAFLELMNLPPHSAISAECLDTAKQALTHAARCGVSQWRLATEGEALLITGSLDAGISRYRQALALAKTQREIDSMYAQAFRVAERVYSEEGVKRVEEAFGLHH
jgi:tetratricopeptide (TPR) repeat protein